jgi:hypothetical protein
VWIYGAIGKKEKYRVKHKKKSNKVSVLKYGVLALALVTTGTFTWTSMSQRAINELKYEFKDTPGGRAHDDYEGMGNLTAAGGNVNKDIYAENYSEKEDMFVRIKLTEYMEIGDGAGNYNLTQPGNVMVPDASNTATVIQGGAMYNATLDNRDSWAPYLPDGLLPDGTTSKFRDYITWDLGDDDMPRKVFMPTFNQNNQDLSSDTSGLGIDEEDWTMNADYGRGKILTGAHDEWALGELHRSVLKTWDDVANQEIQTPGVTHTAKETLTPDQGGYMTMTDWVTAGKPTGNFWVHDKDGWIYWANVIPATEATSLLLDDIDVISLPQDDMYYSINMISDFATQNDLDMWNVNSIISPEAKDMIDALKNL